MNNQNSELASLNHAHSNKIQITYQFQITHFSYFSQLPHFAVLNLPGCQKDHENTKF